MVGHLYSLHGPKKPRRVPPPQWRNKIKIKNSGSMYLGIFTAIVQVCPQDARRTMQIPLPKISEIFLAYFIWVPQGIISSTKMTLQPQALLVPASSIPWLVTPVMRWGFRLATTMIFLPISSSHL